MLILKPKDIEDLWKGPIYPNPFGDCIDSDKLILEEPDGDYSTAFIAEMLRQIEEDEKMVVIDPFVRDMCSYYNIEQDEYSVWQHYYTYLKGEERNLTKVQNVFNEEMKKFVDVRKLLRKASKPEEPLINIEKEENAIWNAIRKG